MQIIDINGTERNCLSVALDPSYPGYMKIEFRNHHEWLTIKEFVDLNPKLASLTTGAPKLPEEDLGVVTSSTEDTIKDSKKNWEVNVYTGFTLWISRGKGETQTRVVTKNSNNTLYIDKPWEIKPNKTSQYVLTQNIIHDSVIHGNSLPAIDQAKFERLAKKMDTVHKKAKKAL